MTKLTLIVFMALIYVNAPAQEIEREIFPAGKCCARNKAVIVCTSTKEEGKDFSVWLQAKGYMAILLDSNPDVKTIRNSLLYMRSVAESWDIELIGIAAFGENVENVDALIGESGEREDYPDFIIVKDQKGDKGKTEQAFFSTPVFVFDSEEGENGNMQERELLLEEWLEGDF